MLRSGPSVEFLQGPVGQADLGQSVIELGGVFPRPPSVKLDFASRLNLLRWRVDVDSRGLFGALSLSILQSCHE